MSSIKRQGSGWVATDDHHRQLFPDYPGGKRRALKEARTWLASLPPRSILASPLPPSPGPPLIRGRACSVSWATDAAGKTQALDFYRSLRSDEQAKISRLLQRLADEGRITDRTRFKPLGAKHRPSRGMYEFKAHQLRFLGHWQSGTFVITAAIRKKQDSHRRQDLERARRVGAENPRGLIQVAG